MTDGERRRPAAVGEVLAAVLARAGLTERVAQAGVIPAWPSLVGAQIAEVTDPVRLQGDGTLVVRVRSHAWMQELSLMERELLQALNGDPGRPPVARLRWVAW